jgi:type IV pilus assembly protein PilO
VTINNIDLKPEEKSGRLRLESTLKTYRYLEDGAEGDAPAKPNNKVASSTKGNKG